MNQILVTRRLPSSVLEMLEPIGNVEIYEGEGAMPAGELLARVAGKHAVVTMLTEQMNKAVFDAGTSLRIVANVAVGYNNIDVPYARSKGITVTNTPDVLTD